jgi:AcrR family transcriptional regulator
MIETTKDKILDSAEKLFAEQGYAGTSLRHIITHAGVNLAAIHYHFGSKEDLLEQLILSRVGPVNETRLALLDRYEAEAGANPVALEDVLEGFLAPAAEMAVKHPEVGRLMGRLHGEGLMRSIAQRHFQTVITRFIAAFRRTLPDLPEQEFLWRLSFMLGAMGLTLVHTPAFAPEMANEPWPARIERLVAFAAGGFRAPVSKAEEVEVVK